jgi:hypothetical protein
MTFHIDPHLIFVSLIHFSHLLVKLFDLIIVFLLDFKGSLLSQLGLNFLNLKLIADINVSQLALVLVAFLDL